MNGICGTLMGTTPESIMTDSGMVYDLKTGTFLYDSNDQPFRKIGDKIVDSSGNVVMTGAFEYPEGDPRNQ